MRAHTHVPVRRVPTWRTKWCELAWRVRACLGGCTARRGCGGCGREGRQRAGPEGRRGERRTYRRPDGCRGCCSGGPESTTESWCAFHLPLFCLYLMCTRTELYETFWSLQTPFSRPATFVQAGAFASFKEAVEKVLPVIKEASAKERAMMGSKSGQGSLKRKRAADAMDTADGAARSDYFFAKFLTSPELLDLEVHSLLLYYTDHLTGDRPADSRCALPTPSSLPASHCTRPRPHLYQRRKGGMGDPTQPIPAARPHTVAGGRSMGR